MLGVGKSRKSLYDVGSNDSLPAFRTLLRPRTRRSIRFFGLDQHVVYGFADISDFVVVVQATRGQQMDHRVIAEHVDAVRKPGGVLAIEAYARH